MCFKAQALICVAGDLPNEARSMNKLLFAGAFAAALVTTAGAFTPVYPSHPVVIICPFAPAGNPLMPLLAERMRVSLGQPVIMEYVSGAAGTIGTARAVRAAPDGYTLSYGLWDSHVLSAAVRSLDYDPLTDLVPVAPLPSNPQLIVSKNGLPAKDMRELIAWLKANPDKATQGTAGAGSAAHISGVQFQNVTGTHFQFVPYRGFGPAMQDLLAGQIDLMIDQAINSLPQIRAGKIRAYAVTSGVRLAAAPDIPTVDEAGLPGFHVSVWRGLWAPKGTPRDIIAKLNAAVVDMLADPAVRQRLVELGQEIPPRAAQTPEALGLLQKAETDKWRPIIKAAGIKVE
jgi:tripartite-type tricarboxylate transporter receptor subunit TctC